MKYQDANANTVCGVLRRFADWLAGEPKEVREDVSDDVNAVLDALLESDAFGTEGTGDPRGDHRG
jgi:hypothetical protein